MTPASPHAIVELDGQRFDSWRDEGLFAAVEAELTTDQASETVWQIFDPDFKFIDRFTSADGVALLPASVWLGFAEDPGEPVFKGLLASVERGAETTSFRFYDMGYRMRLRQHTEYHKKMDNVGIIGKLAKRNGLQFQGPNPPIKIEKHNSTRQEAETDWEFARKLAVDAGLVLYVRGDTLFAQEAAKVGKPVATLAYRRDFQLLKDFSFRFKVPENLEGRPGEVEARGRGRGGKRLTGQSSKHGRGTKRIMLRRSLKSKTKRGADSRAQARKELEREHAFINSLRTLPEWTGQRPDVRETIEVLNVGLLFSGKYICDRVAHSMSPGKLVTSIDFYRDIKTT
jgi:phage protein D